MDIREFKAVLSAFADEPANVDVRAGKVVAEIRDDLIDASISFSADDARTLLVHENDVVYPARKWLINRVARLPQLADRILASIDSGRESQRQPFIVPRGLLSADIAATGDEPVANVLETMMVKCDSAAPGATSVIYITSDAGEGKTTLINRAAREQAARFKARKASSLLVPIPLSGRAFLTFDDAVIAALVNKLRFNYWYFDAFMHLVRIGAIVPAFDGYEEMLVEGSKGEAVSALGNLVQNLDSAGTIFIAARKAFFEYLSFRTQARLLDAIGDRAACFSRLKLSRWSKEQFCEYGRLREAADPSGIYETVSARLGEEHPLLTRAVLVRRLFDVLADGYDRERLVRLLGSNPHDYFFTFVDAIVKREASDKWLARVTGDVMEPLLTPEEHHQLLASIAQEMWQSSSNSLRHDVLDVIVDLFAEGRKKGAATIRQIKERIKQHSLLAADSGRSQFLSFDHEDFQNFYLGEGLGFLLGKQSRADLQIFLSVSLVPIATIEQAVQCLVRNELVMHGALKVLVSINDAELGYSFCKENCGSIAIRLIEGLVGNVRELQLRDMFFSPGVLSGRNIQGATFERCHFQPTSVANSAFRRVAFIACEFERLEIEANALVGCSFLDCTIDSLVHVGSDEQTFDPAVIHESLTKAGAEVDGHQQAPEQLLIEVDQRVTILEKFLRAFLRMTHIDEDLLRLKLGKTHSSVFFDQLLPSLLDAAVLAEVPWKGQGVQRRYKLTRPLAQINRALEAARGSYEAFLSAVRE